MLEKAWEKGKSTKPYLHIQQKLCGKHPEFNCIYPGSRPTDPKLIEDRYGCLFDLDACPKNEYIKTEVKAIPEGVLVGCVSGKKNAIPRSDLNFFPEAIHRDNYERCLDVYISLLLHLISLDLSEDLNLVSNGQVEDLTRSLPRR